ncbi:MAG: DUF4129 domain-containing protein [Planctomycetes bacterium]|nr:DUF4129 domain-containing protein [Planctomycetota bacterium]
MERLAVRYARALFLASFFCALGAAAALFRQPFASPGRACYFGLLALSLLAVFVVGRKVDEPRSRYRRLAARIHRLRTAGPGQQDPARLAGLSVQVGTEFSRAVRVSVDHAVPLFGAGALGLLAIFLVGLPFLAGAPADVRLFLLTLVALEALFLGSPFSYSLLHLTCLTVAVYGSAYTFETQFWATGATIVALVFAFIFGHHREQAASRGAWTGGPGRAAPRGPAGLGERATPVPDGRGSPRALARFGLVYCAVLALCTAVSYFTMPELSRLREWLGGPADGQARPSPPAGAGQGGVGGGLTAARPGSGSGLVSRGGADSAAGPWALRFDSRLRLGPLVQQDPGQVLMRVRLRSMVGEKIIRPEDLPRLWRAAVMDRYDGREWSASETPLRRLVADDPEAGRIWFPPPDLISETGALLAEQQVIAYVPAAGRAIVTITPVQWLGLPEVEVDDHGVLRTPAAPAGPCRYDARAYILPATVRDPAALNRAPKAPPAFDGGRSLALPEGRDEQAYAEIAALAAKVTASARGRYDEARLLAAHLRGGAYVYDPRASSGEKPPGDPLVEFLLRRRVGYCQHFAGSLALLLRLRGIPARVAVGFLNGEWEDLGQCYAVTPRHAHAWTEAWFPGYGWLPFDPSPPPPAWRNAPAPTTGTRSPSPNGGDSNGTAPTEPPGRSAAPREPGNPPAPSTGAGAGRPSATRSGAASGAGAWPKRDLSTLDTRSADPFADHWDALPRADQAPKAREPDPVFPATDPPAENTGEAVQASSATTGGASRGLAVAGDAPREGSSPTGPARRNEEEEDAASASDRALASIRGQRAAVFDALGGWPGVAGAGVAALFLAFLGARWLGLSFVAGRRRRHVERAEGEWAPEPAQPPGARDGRAAWRKFSPGAREVMGEFQRAVGMLTSRGISPEPWMTAGEYAAAATAAFPAVADEVRSLTRLFERARYSADDPPADDVTGASDLAARLGEALAVGGGENSCPAPEPPGER